MCDVFGRREIQTRSKGTDQQDQARTFISDGPGRDRIGPACCFPPSTGVMFEFMCCKVGVVLARMVTPAPVLRVNLFLANTWWAAEWHRIRRMSESVDNAKVGKRAYPWHRILSLPLHVPLHKHHTPQGCLFSPLSVTLSLFLSSTLFLFICLGCLVQLSMVGRCWHPFLFFITNATLLFSLARSPLQFLFLFLRTSVRFKEVIWKML